MSRHFFVHVRRTPKHSVIAHCRSEFVPGGELRIRLLRVTPDQGPAPSIDSLKGRTFAIRSDLRRAIEDLMKETYHGSNNSSSAA